MTATGPADPAPTTTDHDLTDWLGNWLYEYPATYTRADLREQARDLLSSPPLADRLRERDEYAAALARVRAEIAAVDYEAHDEEVTRAVGMWDTTARIIRALDGRDR